MRLLSRKTSRPFFKMIQRTLPFMKSYESERQKRFQRIDVSEVRCPFTIAFNLKYSKSSQSIVTWEKRIYTTLLKRREKCFLSNMPSESSVRKCESWKRLLRYFLLKYKNNISFLKFEYLNHSRKNKNCLMMKRLQKKMQPSLMLFSRRMTRTQSKPSKSIIVHIVNHITAFNNCKQS